MDLLVAMEKDNLLPRTNLKLTVHNANATGRDKPMTRQGMVAAMSYMSCAGTQFITLHCSLLFKIRLLTCHLCRA